MSGVELALSASGSRLLCAIRLPGGAVAVPSDRQLAGRGTDVAVAVDELFRTHELRPSSLSAIRVDVGPGSYTGLRVATTFARTIASFAGALLFRFTSLELTACAAWTHGEAARDRDIVVVLDARRGRFHVGRLRLSRGRIEPVEPGPAAVGVNELEQWLRPAATVIADEALLETLREPCGATGSKSIATRAASAEDLFDPAIVPTIVSAEAIEPLYLMATYADD